MGKRWVRSLLGVVALVALLAPLSTSAGADDRAAPREAARWRTITSQGFEGTFPPVGGKWEVLDYNGSVGTAPGGGTTYWDDSASDAHTGTYSAHPNDFNAYSNLTDTWMTYGPFSLIGASDARLQFSYRLDTEEFYDFFTWSYSCDSGSSWTERTVSGSSNGNWRNVTTSLRPCRNHANALVRFWFRSDTSTTAGGVWVDDIKIQKFA